MAHSILYKPQGVLLSYSIGEISISVDGDYVDVLLDMPGKTLYSERLYPFDGIVTIYDIASLIEHEMRAAALAYAEFSLKVFSDTVTEKADVYLMRILYCDRYVPQVDTQCFLAENFLSTLNMRRVSDSSAISIFFFAEEGESVAYSVEYRGRRLDNGEAVHQRAYFDSGSTAAAAGIVQVNIQVGDMTEALADSNSLSLDMVKLQSFTVRSGNRSMSFFIDDLMEDADCFYFRNCFNVWDWAALPAVTSAKTEVEKSTAVINGSTLYYDRSSSKSYQLDSAPLTSDEADLIDQLITSYEVFRIEYDRTSPESPFVMAPVLISDSSCEVNDGDSAPNSVKLTWRYAVNRPIVHLSASPGIFSSPFDSVFS